MDHAPEEEILSVLDVPPGKMGRVIGRKGVTILSIKESCKYFSLSSPLFIFFCFPFSFGCLHLMHVLQCGNSHGRC